MDTTETRTDWWDRLYDPSVGDTASAAEQPPRGWWRTTPQEPEMGPESGVELDDAERWVPPSAPEQESAPEPSRRGERVGAAVQAATEGLIRPRARRLLFYSAPAAGVGWWAGLGPALRNDVLAACGAEASVGAALFLGAGVCALTYMAVDRRTRGWWPPLAWVCHIPYATAVAALLLYAPGTGLS